MIITSSHGTLEVHNNGCVARTDLAPSFGAVPVYVNIAEWRRHYPSEPLLSEGDILDFGYIDSNGAYSEPCEDWRAELAASRKASKQLAKETRMLETFNVLCENADVVRLNGCTLCENADVVRRRMVPFAPSGRIQCPYTDHLGALKTDCLTLDDIKNGNVESNCFIAGDGSEFHFYKLTSLLRNGVVC